MIFLAILLGTLTAGIGSVWVAAWLSFGVMSRYTQHMLSLAAGALMAQTTGFASLDVFALERSADVMLMLVIGGVGWLYGGVLGAVVFKLMHDIIPILRSIHQVKLCPLKAISSLVIHRDRQYWQALLFEDFHRSIHVASRGN